MKKKSIGICTFLLIVFSGYSQQNYLPGKILKLNGDTLHGFINYQNWDKNPLNVYFRSDMDQEPNIFSPREIQSFVVANEIYRTATVTVNEGFYKTSDLGYSTDISFRTETVFLQTLIRGAKSLYYFKDSEGREQFYVELDAKLELLVYHKYLKDLHNTGNSTNSNSIAEDKRYVGQLSFYLKDCPDIQTQLRYLNYGKQSLVKLFRHYYECKDSNADFVKKSDETKADYGVFAGLSITMLNFEGYQDYYDELANSDFPVSYNPAFGIFLNKKLSRNMGKFSLHNELFFSGYKTDAFYQDFMHENRYENNYMTFGGFFIKLNNMLQYDIPVKSISLMMRLGITNGWNINETNQKIVESVFYSTTTTTISPAIDETRIYAIGILGGIGANYKRCSFDIRYEQNSGMSDLPTVKSSVRTLYFLVGYRF